MFEGLEWKNAFKRAAIIFAIWLFSIYALSIAFPGTFNLGFDSRAGITTFAINAVFFFFFFVVLTAFIERSKKRNAARLRAAKTPKKDKPGTKTTAGSQATEDGESEPSTLKGRHNPNTSRKKATRRRR
jgi:hypothetical protein